MVSGDVEVLDRAALTPASLAVAEVRSMPIEALRSALVEQTKITAEHIGRLALIWAKLERRGEDMTKLRTGLARYLPAVAARRLVPEAVVRLAGNSVALRAVSYLTPERQQEVIEAGVVEVVRDDPTKPETVPLTQLTQADVSRAFDATTGDLIAPANQRRAVARRRVNRPFDARVVVPLTREEHRNLLATAERSKRSAADLIRQMLKNDGAIG